jgi:hypothetical protein
VAGQRGGTIGLQQLVASNDLVSHPLDILESEVDNFTSMAEGKSLEAAVDTTPERAVQALAQAAPKKQAAQAKGVQGKLATAGLSKHSCRDHKVIVCLLWQS